MCFWARVARVSSTAALSLDWGESKHVALVGTSDPGFGREQKGGTELLSRSQRLGRALRRRSGGCSVDGEAFWS